MNQIFLNSQPNLLLWRLQLNLRHFFKLALYPLRSLRALR